MTKKISRGNYEKCHHIILEEDPGIGVYIYVWLTEASPSPERDHLQDTWDIAYEQCEEDYGVPKDCWDDLEDTPN